MAVEAVACSFWLGLHAVKLTVKNKRMTHDSLALYDIWVFLQYYGKYYGGEQTLLCRD
jgi:hypothetical protein